MSDTTEITYSNKADGLSSLAAAAGADSKYANAMKFLREGALRDAPQENATTRDIQETRAAQRDAKTDFTAAAAAPQIVEPATRIAAEPELGKGVGTLNADGSQSLPEVRIIATPSRSAALNLPTAVEPIAPIERQALEVPSVVVAEAPKQLAPVVEAKRISVAKQAEPKQSGPTVLDRLLTAFGAQSPNFRRYEYMQQMYPVPPKKPDNGPAPRQ